MYVAMRHTPIRMQIGLYKNIFIHPLARKICEIQFIYVIRRSIAKRAAGKSRERREHCYKHSRCTLKIEINKKSIFAFMYGKKDFEGEAPSARMFNVITIARVAARKRPHLFLLCPAPHAFLCVST